MWIWGHNPDGVAGHSLGEYSALAAAGGIDFETGLELVKVRSNSMDNAGKLIPGTMAAVIDIFILGNLSGYIFYWVFSFIALIISGINISDALYDFGLYPFLTGNGYSYASWVIYYLGILLWFFSLLLSSSAVSSLTIKQLKGDNFFSVNDAIDEGMKYENSWIPRKRNI